MNSQPNFVHEITHKMKRKLKEHMFNLIAITRHASPYTRGIISLGDTVIDAGFTGDNTFIRETGILATNVDGNAMVFEIKYQVEVDKGAIDQYHGFIEVYPYNYHLGSMAMIVTDGKIDEGELCHFIKSIEGKVDELENI